MQKLNNQQIFNKVAKHLLKQNKQSLLAFGSVCAYKNPDGLKCAIGCLIPNQLYSPGMEEKSIRQIFKNSYGLQALFKDESLDLLETLQNLHDMDKPNRWESGLRIIAKDYGLDASVLNKAKIK
jgi:hypothetical protein